MKLNDFICITPEMLDIAEDIIKNRKCNSLKCRECAFSYKNAVNGLYCSKNGYAEHGNESIAIKSAKELLELVK